MTGERDNQNVWLERLVIVVLSSFYLIIFNVSLPHGDALKIVRQIEAHNLVWNPNHLIFDPAGYAWYTLLNKIGFDISPLTSFEIISSVATVISLLIFHVVLVEAGIRKKTIYAIALLGLFASKNFLSMAVTQYYFMLQMPFLLGALYFGIRFFSSNQEKQTVNLFAAGALLAIATAIEVNNVALILMLGLAIVFMFHKQKVACASYVVKFWSAAAAVGFPIFIYGYLASGTDGSFISWLLSYGGESGSTLDKHYGLQLSIKGIAASFARMGFNLFFGNLIETAGLGTVISSIVFGETLEFSPGITRITLAAILMPFTGFMLLVLFLWSIRNIRQMPINALLLAWICAYLMFAFFWNNGSDIFWFQMLPAIWLMFAINLNVTEKKLSTGNAAIFGGWRTSVLVVLVPLLLILNTLQTVVPVSLIDLQARAREHNQLLRKGDLEITTGWDKYKWITMNEGGPKVSRLMLMNLAVLPGDDEQYIGRLPQIIDEHLSTGKRVIAARIYDLDEEINPWYGLSRQGWSRARIISMLKDYCNRAIGKVDGVVFREIYNCKRDRQNK